MKLREPPALIPIAAIVGYLIGREISRSRPGAARNSDAQVSKTVTRAAPNTESDSGDDFKGGYQTVVAIIQGVAFVTLAVTTLPTMHASIAGGQVTRSFTVATQALVTLIAIIIVTDSYIDLTRAAHWDPTILDTAVPYILGSSEVAAAAWVGNTSLWWAALSSLLLVSAAADKHSSIRAKAEDFIDAAAYRQFRKAVRGLAMASLTTLAFSVVVCLLSIYADLSWFYAIAPLIAATVFIVCNNVIGTTAHSIDCLGVRFALGADLGKCRSKIVRPAHE